MSIWGLFFFRNNHWPKQKLHKGNKSEGKSVKVAESLLGKFAGGELVAFRDSWAERPVAPFLCVLP